MIKLLGFAAAALAGAGLLLAPSAVADNPDPHTPNGAALWCPGGMGNNAMIPYCNGLPYEDGSYLTQTAAHPFGFGGPASLPWNQPVLVTP